MYRCIGCDAPAQTNCECSEVKFQLPREEQPKIKKINIASGEDVVLEQEEELAHA